jgi:hypothetical protein
VLLAVSATAGTITITFSEFPVGTVITNQYQALGVTFSGAAGDPPVIADDSAMPDSPILSPNPPYAGDFYINFIGDAGVDVQFDSGSWDYPLGLGTIDVYDTSSVLVASLTDTTLGVEHFDLSSYGTIGQIYFDSTNDPGGADIGDLQFSPAGAAPEPGSLLLLGSGLGLIALLRRKL